ncbi:hypothetical protein [Butyrivibrio sp. YAB3001]|uniref:hypothetical protein n=1 Tax=Butyrivibrio sp. YAB3001 TaxID=1520812 RepID=UPI0008F66F1B|nr:hypothetical protein [Butyrivibrio sp. YAB3001]SFC55787.1 hypothetical protein SAMN02910398_02557 [Butyrivibrio sp. YAB3001]
MGGKIENITIQGIGGTVDTINQMRLDQYLNNLKIQNTNLEKAIEELSKARDFLGSPEHILGTMATKHGEVAEVFDVRFGNADRIIRGEDPNFTFDGVGRTAAEDYLKNYLPIQSKFVQSNLSIDAVINHLKDYPDFVEKGGSYCIPKDFYEQIEIWRKLSPEELTKLPASEGGRLARNVISRVHELEDKAGKSFAEVVEPSQCNYDQVQLNCAGNTIDGKENEIIEVDNKLREKYWEMSRASVTEGLKMAGIAAAISGVISFSVSLISVMKGQNKNISELTKEDWMDILKQTGIGVVKGGVSGGAIYILTNVAGVSAPLAAGIVSGTLGIATEAVRLYRKEITLDDFIYNAIDVATEAAVSAAGAFAGQLLIPVPVLGAIIGSMVTTAILGMIKKYIFGGGFYELVKQAHKEKEFSDEYKPLVEAFEQASSEWERLEKEITNMLRPYINASESVFERKVENLSNYIEGI